MTADPPGLAIDREKGHDDEQRENVPEVLFP